MPKGSAPKLLVTGFGPFPGAAENPTKALVEALAGEPAETFGAQELRAVVLPTEYRRSWAMLSRHYASYAPDVVVHFGLSASAEAIMVERFAQNRADPDKPDAIGYMPRSGRVRQSGPDMLAATLPVDAIVEALQQAGFPAAASDDAGGYVCNATLYRSLHAAPTASRRVSFVHLPPSGTNGLTPDRLRAAAAVILKSSAPA
jgi:pyroglutamyl-peptidase